MKIFKVKNVEIGEGFTIFAGPCSVESEGQLLKTLDPIIDNVDVIRGGAFKPRTSPESFQGLGKEGLEILKRAGEKFKKPVVTEVMTPEEVELVSSFADILQIGARNMQNYPLLKEVGKSSLPVFLKRGFSATLEEWLGSLAYVVKEGNEKVILCERGIRTFEKATRFTLDLSGAILARKKTERPVVIDPSHATGNPSLIAPLVLASKAAGLDGAMVEVHYDPESAKSDAEQALKPEEFNRIFNDFES